MNQPQQNRQSGDCMCVCACVCVCEGVCMCVCEGVQKRRPRIVFCIYLEVASVWDELGERIESEVYSVDGRASSVSAAAVGLRVVMIICTLCTDHLVVEGHGSGRSGSWLATFPKRRRRHGRSSCSCVLIVTSARASPLPALPCSLATESAGSRLFLSVIAHSSVCLCVFVCLERL